MRKLILLVWIIALCGCGGTKWCKEGATASDFQTDFYNCKLRARQMAQLGGIYDPFGDISAQNECLRQSGWSPCDSTSDVLPARTPKNNYKNKTNDSLFIIDPQLL